MNTNTNTVPNGSIIPFLQTHAAGAALYDVSDALEAVAKAVAMTGRKGKLKMGILIKPAGRASGALAYEVDITKTLPKPEQVMSIWFVDPETGHMSRDNPRQLQMPLESVPGQPATGLEATGTVRMAAAS